MRHSVDGADKTPLSSSRKGRRDGHGKVFYLPCKLYFYLRSRYFKNKFYHGHRCRRCLWRPPSRPPPPLRMRTRCCLIPPRPRATYRRGPCGVHERKGPKARRPTGGGRGRAAAAARRAGGGRAGARRRLPLRRPRPRATVRGRKGIWNFICIQLNSIASSELAYALNCDIGPGRADRT